MKKLTMTLFFTIALFMLVGCGSDTNEESTADASEDGSVAESAEGDTTETNESTSTSEAEESDTDNVNDTSSAEADTDSSATENSDMNADNKEDKDPLSEYSSEQIEYARVWLQLGPNQELEELYVKHIPADTPLNPEDETSASYPEDVIQLSGTRLVSGSVTYSGNGDGTVNVYNVPLRWDGQYPAGKEFYSNIIENTKLVSIDPGDDEEVIELIEVLNAD
ncbi:hypothetical protein [Lentibacillus sediminis]|uniref:hypothetical protein n=1 Tax=Lentibacillus sediminis TaxID=1940529 RepID=UPI000C1B9E05|nr:hypothetical protein [Lentibacillus sediminis]